MNRKVLLSVVCAAFMLCPGKSVFAQNDTTAHKSRLTIGGYGEAVYSHHFYSDNVFRYSHADRYKDAPGYGRVDIPHAVIMSGYDFGRGWSVGTEIEFEHGGVEAAVEKETEETGEFEQEIERGGEVALEQFWVQKSFGKHLNIRAGHIVVPVGMTNNNHTPNMFFGVYRPEGENTIMPCTWHETGVSVWGRAGRSVTRSNCCRRSTATCSMMPAGFTMARHRPTSSVRQTASAVPHVLTGRE